MTVQMKAIKQYFPVVLFTFQCFPKLRFVVFFNFEIEGKKGRVSGKTYHCAYLTYLDERFI